MCLFINISVPALNYCLLIYPLKDGSYVAVSWCLIRAIVVYVFFLFVILEALIAAPSDKRVDFILLKKIAEAKDDFKSLSKADLLLVYYSTAAMLTVSAITVVSMCTIYNGIYCFKPILVKIALKWRLMLWIKEIVALVLLCVVHKLLALWYLVILATSFVELYCMLVINSYYIEMVVCGPEAKCCDGD